MASKPLDWDPLDMYTPSWIEFYFFMLQKVVGRTFTVAVVIDPIGTK